MGWFQKDKNEKNGADGTAAAVSPLGGSGMQGEDGNSLCRSRLHQLLNPETGTARGVAMKLHLEHFKRLNEILGYDYCQELLAQIISYLEQETGCPVYRSIGVEFFIFLTDTSVSQATELVEDILAHFDHVWTVNGTVCPVQIGLCPYPTYTDSADEMMKFLDMALSAAAEAGRPSPSICSRPLRNRRSRCATAPPTMWRQRSFPGRSTICGSSFPASAWWGHRSFSPSPRIPDRCGPWSITP